MSKDKWAYLVVIVVVLALACVLRYVRSKRNDVLPEWKMQSEQEENIMSDTALILRIPKFYRALAGAVVLVCVAISIGIAIASSKEIRNLMWLLPCWMIGLPVLILFICWSLWKVETDGDGFTYRNFWGKSKRYQFADLEYEMANSGLKWWFFKDGKKVLCVAYYVENENELLTRYDNCTGKLREDEE